MEKIPLDTLIDCRDKMQTAYKILLWTPRHAGGASSEISSALRHLDEAARWIDAYVANFHEQEQAAEGSGDAN